jgi:tetratricopeptide (TPR) repeat protein
MELGIPRTSWTAPREALAGVLRSRGNYTEADSILLGVLAQNRQGTDSVRLAHTLRSLGHVKLGQGDGVAAESFYQEALALYRGMWKPDHPEVAAGMVNLANALRDQHRYIEAETLYVAALEIGERALGTSHVDVALIRADYARLLAMRGDTSAAVGLYRQAGAILHPRGGMLIQASMVMLNFGELLADQGEFAEADSLLREALVGLERVRGAEDPLTRRARNGLARIR